MAGNDSSDLSGKYVSVKEAAKMLGLSTSRVYKYLGDGRLTSANPVGRIHLVTIESIEELKPKLKQAGRPRTKPPKWHTYQKQGLVAVEIRIQIRSELREQIEQATKGIRAKLEGKGKKKGEKYTLTGSIARYVLNDRSEPYRVSIWLFWKDTERPDKETYEREMEEFRHALADVLDWSTAEYSEKNGIVYT